MSIPSVGLTVDKSDVVTGKTGANFVVGRLKAMSTQATTDRKLIDPVEFRAVMDQLGQHLVGMNPVEFYANASIRNTLLDALGVTDNSTPNSPDV